MLGLRQFEASEAAVAWRFRMRATALPLSPIPIYGPSRRLRPVDWRGGVTVAGNPRFWLISADGSICSPARSTATAFAAILSISWCGRLRAGRRSRRVWRDRSRRSARRRGIAPGDERRHDKTFPSFPNFRSAPCGVRDLAAGRCYDRMPGGDVPFARGASRG